MRIHLILLALALVGAILVGCLDSLTRDPIDLPAALKSANPPLQALDDGQGS